MTILTHRISGLALALFILVPSGSAEPIRVTTWNLQAPTAPRTNGTQQATASGNRILAAATALKQLDPDVILLQQVRDWKMCEQLAQALKPDKYNVLVCSAFQDMQTGTLRRQQVAILAKAKAYFSWSEAWHSQDEPAPAGGFAFAALQIGKERIGVFSVQAPVSPAGAAGKQQAAARQQARVAAAVGQVLAQVGSVSNWVANRVQVFVVGGTFGFGGRQRLTAQTSPLRLLEEAGFSDAFAETPVADRVTTSGGAGQGGTTADYLFTQPAG